jgi:hypothetical protein
MRWFERDNSAMQCMLHTVRSLSVPNANISYLIVREEVRIRFKPTPLPFACLSFLQQITTELRSCSVRHLHLQVELRKAYSEAA